MNLSKLIPALAASMAIVFAAGTLVGCTDSGVSPSDTDQTSQAVEDATRIINGLYTDKDGNILLDDNNEPVTAPEVGEVMPTDAQGSIILPDAPENGGSSQSSDGSSSRTSSSNSESS